MKIQTSRFGEVEIDEKAIVTMSGGLIGFPEHEHYILIRHHPESPFYWFQAVDDPNLAFVIVDPLVFKPDYKIPLGPLVLKNLGASTREELNVFVIVTIPQGQPEAMTANLLGPLVINTQARLARQLVLDDSKYSHRHPILSDKGSSGQKRNSASDG